MGINFPYLEDIKLNHPPLEEVITQVKFPPILRINNDIPTNLQEIIRRRFPLYRSEINLQSLISPRNEDVKMSNIIHRFSSEKEDRTFSLASNFIAYSDSKYLSWEDYIDNLKFIQTAVIECYQPAFTIRVGLRFINGLTIENTKTETIIELINLLKPELFCLMQNEVWSDVSNFASQIIIPNGEDRLAIRYSYIDSPMKIILDYDMYTEKKLPITDLLGQYEKYHRIIYNAFRWSFIDGNVSNFN